MIGYILYYLLIHRYVAFLSGLDLGSSCDSLLSIQEMVFALVGKTGSPELQKMMSQIGRLIIAGKSVLIFYNAYN